MVGNGSFPRKMTCNQRRLKHFWVSLFILFSCPNLAENEDQHNKVAVAESCSINNHLSGNARGLPYAPWLFGQELYSFSTTMWWEASIQSLNLLSIKPMYHLHFPLNFFHLHPVPSHTHGSVWPPSWWASFLKLVYLSCLFHHPLSHKPFIFHPHHAWTPMYISP